MMKCFVDVFFVYKITAKYEKERHMKAVDNGLNHAWYVVKVTIKHQNDNNTLSRIKPFNTFIPEIANSSCHFFFRKNLLNMYIRKKPIYCGDCLHRKSSDEYMS